LRIFNLEKGWLENAIIAVSKKNREIGDNLDYFAICPIVKEKETSKSSIGSCTVHSVDVETLRTVILYEDRDRAQNWI
jgi:hypothetical protein